MPLDIPKPSMLRHFFYHKGHSKKIRALLIYSASFVFVLLCWALFFMLCATGAEESGYFWQWFRVNKDFLRILPWLGFDSFFSSPMWEGIIVTLQVALLSLLLALCVALCITAMTMAGGPVARLFSIAYVELFRNTPLLVQLFFMYTVPAPIWGLSAQTTAVITLGFCHGAFMSESLRGGIESVPKGQYKAAIGLGFTPFCAVTHIVFPQAVRNCLPPILNQSIILIKDTSLTSVISVTDLTFHAKQYASASFTVFETWIAVACIYLVICLFFSIIVDRLKLLLGKGLYQE